jgi:hypothetical protein
MHRFFALVVALGMVAVFSGAVCAEGMCNYGVKMNQAATDKADTAKTLATKTPEKAEADKLLLAQTEKAAKPAPETQK